MPVKKHDERMAGKRRRSGPNGFNVSPFSREVCMRTRKVKSGNSCKYVSAANGKDNITTVYGLEI